MDAFVKKLEQLSAIAAGRPEPQSLDCALVMSRIHGLNALHGLSAEMEDFLDDNRVLSLPLRFWASGAAAAAAVAMGVTTLASTAWMEMASPFAAVDTLLTALPY